MSLPTSSNSSSLSDGSPHPAAANSKARGFADQQSRTDLDLALKLRVGAALSTSGYYTRVNVGLSATSAHRLADVTDVDVLAMRYDLTFSQDTIAVSCKTGGSKALSPAREIFYLRGVLDYVHAENGVVAFSRKPISPHLRDLGRRLNILVLSSDEIEEWCKSLVQGLPDFGYFQEDAYNEYLKSWAHVNGRGLADYIRTDYWFHFDFRNLQNVIAHMRKVSSRLTGQERWNALVILDTAVLLCFTVFGLCRHIRLLGLSSVAEKTAEYLFGGAASFKARRDLYAKVEQLLSSTGVIVPNGPSLPPLEPTYTKGLAELVIRFIDRPHAAILIPQVLQDNMWRLLGARGSLSQDDTTSLAAEKLSQDLLDFLKIATGAGWVPKI